MTDGREAVFGSVTVEDSGGGYDGKGGCERTGWVIDCFNGVPVDAVPPFVSMGTGLFGPCVWSLKNERD